MYSELNIKVNDLVETNKFAKKFAKFVTPPFFLCLKGEIGSGKTTFTRFLIKQFSKKNINIPSPTFPIVQVYEFEKIKIWHYDLYRIENKEVNLYPWTLDKNKEWANKYNFTIDKLLEDTGDRIYAEWIKN